MQKKIIGYFTEWSMYQREFSVNMIPADKYTHISYAFMLPNPSPSDLETFKANNPFPPLPYYPPPQKPEASLVTHDEHAFKTHIPKLNELRKKHPHLKLGISIGGWTLSWTFSKLAADPVMRKVFVESSVDKCIELGWDYLSIDWEFQGKQGIGFNYVDEENDGKNFLLMLKEMREYMDLKSPNKRLEITSAAGCNPIVLANFKGADKYLDSLELMTYDFHGPWAADLGYLTPIYHNPNDKDNNPAFCIDAAVQTALKLGYKPEQICIGAAFYGRGWVKATQYNPDSNEIFGQATKTTGHTLSGDYGEPPTGLSSWRDIRDALKSGEFKEYYDEKAQAAWCKNAAGSYISYDNERTIEDKCDYIVENKLGGFLIWEMSDDTRDGKDSLLDAMNNRLKHLGENPIEGPKPETPEPSPEPTEPILKDNLEVEIVNNTDEDLVIKPGQKMTFKLN